MPRNDRRPHVEVVINGRKIVGLLDSGANVTMLGKGAEYIINTLPTTTNKSNVKIRTADGSVHATTNVVDIPYQLNGETKHVTTLIIPTIATQLILGTNFWDQFNIRPMICCLEQNEIDNEVPKKHDPVNIKHDLSPDQQSKLDEVIQTFDVAKVDGVLGYTTRTTHEIDTGDTPPIKQRQYVVSPYIQTAIHEEIDRMLAKDIITRIENPTWLNPMVAVKKPNGKYRLCIDARQLNNVTVKSAYPQPNANRILGRLQGTKYLSAIDLTDAFYQIKLGPESQRKTAFAIQSRGTFMFKRMPMGLCNSSATISELVESVFGCALEPWVFHFIDDFIIATDTFEKHMEILAMVARKLREAGLQISTQKSRFCMSKLVFLGYVIDESGVQADPEKVAPIVNMPTPKNVKDVRRLIGMAGWYRRFIRDFSGITAPMTNLIKKAKQNFTWTEEAQAAFDRLKGALTSAPILGIPDFNLPFQIECDASDLGMGAVLVQVQDGEERVIAYMSAKLNSAQRNYHVTERECLAVLTAIEKFRQYIEGTKFTVITDHASLVWLRNFKDPTGKIARWALRLQAHDFDIKHRKGAHMVVPDALSRAIESVELVAMNETEDLAYMTLRTAIEQRPNEHVDYRVDHGVIIKHVGMRYTSDDDGWRIVVPTDFRKEILMECHDDVLAAHGGYLKTLHRVQRRYFWPRMRSEIAKYINHCETCRAIKPSNQRQVAPMGKYRDPERPWKMIALDFMGPYPLTRRGNRQILVVIDLFSKFVLIKPIKRATADATVTFLKENVFLKYGVPEIVISDNGVQLKSNVFADFLAKYNVLHWKTANYHAQANATEAANKTIKHAIRAYIRIEKTQRDWDVNLPELNCALNTSYHTSTKFTPFAILYGYEMHTNASTYTAIDNEVRQTPQFEAIRQRAAMHLREAYEASKRQYDTRARDITYNVNDIVWKKNTMLSKAGEYLSSRLMDRYVKCKVKAKVGTNTYLLTDMNNKEIGIYSTKDLKP